MTYAIFYDTETTGFPSSAPLDHEGQPHLCQLGAQIVDLSTRKVISSLDVIIIPKGWTIPDHVAAIHGIDHALAQSVGIDEGDAVSLFLQMLQGYQRIGHNEQFDSKILGTAIARYFPGALERWQSGPTGCTAERSKPLVQCPPTLAMLRAGRRGFKTPKLSEAYEFFFDKPLIGAHNAMVDVEGCRDVWFACDDHDNHILGQAAQGGKAFEDIPL